MKTTLPEQNLLEGIKILSTYLEPLGFQFKFLGKRQSSGGNFAFGEFVCGDRKIELHYRYSLGLVSYQVSSLILGHEHYIDLLDKHGKNKYPNFSDESMEAFKCLKFDLENLLQDFAENNANIFREKAPTKIIEFKINQEIKKEANKKIDSGDQKIIEEAKIEFKKGNYLEVQKFKLQIKYPELMTKAEKKLFEINDKRI